MDRLSRTDMICKLLEEDPADVFLNYALGLEFVSELNLDDGEKQFKKTLELDPNYIAAYYQLGKVYESRVQNEEALRIYREGLKKAREQGNTKAAGEFDEAIFMLEG
jgi:Tfp pilus assembly protein PilF